MSLNFKLNSSRLSLCLPKMGTEEEVIKFYLENDAFFAPWSPEKTDNFFDKSFRASRIELAHQEFQLEQSLKLNIYLKETEELVGMINFTNIERGPFQNCRLGYKLAEKFQGQGYMKEALEVGIDYVFSQLGLHRIEANYIPTNRRSGNVLKSLGFQEHGLAPNYLKIDGKWQDHVLTSKLSKIIL